MSWDCICNFLSTFNVNLQNAIQNFDQAGIGSDIGGLEPVTPAANATTDAGSRATVVLLLMAVLFLFSTFGQRQRYTTAEKPGRTPPSGGNDRDPIF
uniref:Uncharacterized protein n=1 Tax=Chromera velia CCMP2878 TaxID=1169474 RepID=A0A0G4GG58_9ALVE|mmetsp:Transcript_10098/g.19539  ORF Transcript_10098/g.19539 Transcript_10098/m.19539 type:complete len:97 (-) Transcript_10098:1937-2227(-)|eukprot:Cvel_21692.t1-p1 / transcript=Cvel_21692.t1 / gene=Cvel_21692 / organism=Chromera_velia_CCMP2878 / gene_product=hypothetical protein / transcript_product=hypothetical protein / location=Cvel_scaffold2056:30531-30989(+) / protein_length=96 / sequence_SO=supercontig / SO=protein_coding / is_pseudo=false